MQGSFFSGISSHRQVSNLADFVGSPSTWLFFEFRVRTNELLLHESRLERLAGKILKSYWRCSVVVLFPSQACRWVSEAYMPCSFVTMVTEISRSVAWVQMHYHDARSLWSGLRQTFDSPDPLHSLLLNEVVDLVEADSQRETRSVAVQWWPVASGQKLVSNAVDLGSWFPPPCEVVRAFSPICQSIVRSPLRSEWQRVRAHTVLCCSAHLCTAIWEPQAFSLQATEEKNAASCLKDGVDSRNCCSGDACLFYCVRIHTIVLWVRDGRKEVVHRRSPAPLPGECSACSGSLAKLCPLGPEAESDSPLVTVSNSVISNRVMSCLCQRASGSGGPRCKAICLLFRLYNLITRMINVIHFYFGTDLISVMSVLAFFT